MVLISACNTYSWSSSGRYSNDLVVTGWSESWSLGEAFSSRGDLTANQSMSWSSMRFDSRIGTLESVVPSLEELLNG